MLCLLSSICTAFTLGPSMYKIQKERETARGNEKKGTKPKESIKNLSHITNYTNIKFPCSDALLSSSQVTSNLRLDWIFSSVFSTILRQCITINFSNHWHFLGSLHEDYVKCHLNNLAAHLDDSQVKGQLTRIKAMFRGEFFKRHAGEKPQRGIKRSQTTLGADWQDRVSLNYP